MGPQIAVAPLQPLGARVSLDLAGGLDDAHVAALKAVLAEHGVLVVPDQHVDDTQFLSFLSRFGEPIFTEGETPVDGFPDLNVVSNVGRTTPPRSVFHTDTSYVADPPAYTALRAVMIPAEGGQTQFTDQYRAYETLPADLQERLRGRTIRHQLADGSEYADHPALLSHPVSGRTALYLSTPERCVSISGVPEDEARHLIAFLYRHSTEPRNTYSHEWSAGDVVMWDNRCVLHRADHSGVVGDRVMHRGMVTAGSHAV